jgi:hypothetical protein
VKILSEERDRLARELETEKVASAEARVSAVDVCASVVFSS